MCLNNSRIIGLKKITRIHPYSPVFTRRGTNRQLRIDPEATEVLDAPRGADARVPSVLVGTCWSKLSAAPGPAAGPARA